MSIEKKFIEHVKHFSFIQKNVKHVLAVSGGVDSVALCHLMFAAGYDFVIAHCNFQLRGEESERDEAFVKALSAKYGKEILVKKFDTGDYAAGHKISKQVAARELRYSWFRQIINGEQQSANDRLQGADIRLQDIGNLLRTSGYIITAHHADDNLETVVMNFFRGTGLRGLTGMDNLFQQIFRPLLPFRKEEILAYANENNLAFAEDSSNANSYYTRNYFRNDLLPAVKKVFPQVEENILKNIERLTEVSEIYKEAVQNQIKKLVKAKGNEWHIPILKLQKQVAYKTILWEIIKQKSFAATQTDEVIKLLDANNSSHVDSPAYRIIKNRCWLIIASLQQPGTAQHIIIGERDKRLSFAAGELFIEQNIPSAGFSISNDKNVAAVNNSALIFPLLLRKWKKGDYFYPLGMQKKKKLSKFFIDQKLSATVKENTWVMEMNKKIVWVVGHRIDDRFKVLPATGHITRIVFSPVL